MTDLDRATVVTTAILKSLRVRFASAVARLI